MHRTLLVLSAVTALLLSACSDMGSGTSSSGSGITPPVTANSAGPGGSSINGMHPSGAPGQTTPTPSAPPGNTATYSLADATSGIRCPDVNGYSCIIHLNVPVATASPGAKGTPSPSPTPSATPTPSSSTSPQPSPSATPSLTLHLEANTKDVPAMVNPTSKSVATEALIAVRVTANTDITLNGKAAVDFILPQGQMGGRSFALQLFRESNGRRRSDTFVGAYTKATATETTLHYEVTPPQVTTKHGETWLFVLYANELPSMTPTPGPTASPSAAPSASAAASSVPTASASP